MFTLIVLIFTIIVVHSDLKDIYEFFLFKGELRTHRFKERIYPRKYSFLRRFFMLTYFDEELGQKFKYKKQMKAVVIADIIYLLCSLLIVIYRIYCLSIGKYDDLGYLDDLNLPEVTLFISSYIFGMWYIIKSTRWREWIKIWTGKNPHGRGIGRYDFQIRLPDEKKKKK